MGISILHLLLETIFKNKENTPMQFGSGKFFLGESANIFILHEFTFTMKSKYAARPSGKRTVSIC
jgi:hypothetical protein